MGSRKIEGGEQFELLQNNIHSIYVTECRVQVNLSIKREDRIPALFSTLCMRSNRTTNYHGKPKRRIREFYCQDMFESQACYKVQINYI